MDGAFDIHVTLDAATPPDRAADLADRYALKFTHIELARGAVRSQPMLSAVVSGTLEHARAEAARLRDAAHAERLRVVRIKIEAAPWNSGVPVDDVLAPPDRYFEHHVKVLLTGADAADLAPRVRPFDAHVSRNARRTRPDGRHERFVTQRCPGVGGPTAERRLDALLTALADHEVMEVEREYVVDDDNLDLDAGWIATRPSGGPR